jgi:putative salt-induced outer membrane protein YdiY
MYGRAAGAPRISFRLAFVSILCAIGLAALPDRVRSDEIRLENGDVLHGKVTGADDKNIHLKHAFGDEFKVPLEKVFSVRTDEAVPVRLKDGSLIRGRLGPGPESHTASVTLDDGNKVEKLDFKFLAGIGEPPPEAVWSGKIALGMTIQDGNTQSKTFFASFDGERRSKVDLIEGHAYYAYGETLGQVSTRKSFARLQYNYFVLHPLYLYAGAALEYDRFRDLSLRSRGGLGLGYAWVDDETMLLRTEAGAEYVNENFRVAEDRSFVALRGALNFRWNITSWLTFSEFLEIYPDVEDFERFVLHSETSATLALWKGFGLAGVVIWDHVHRPPSGREKNDEQYVITLTYAF